MSTSPNLPDMLAQSNCRAILPVLEAKVLRKVADRSKGSEIGYVICPRTNIANKTESGNEHNAVLYCFFDRAIERVMMQSARIFFNNAAGERTHHTLDVRAKRFDGHIHGLLVKPDSKSVDSDLRTFTRMLAAVTPKKVADDLNYVTERDMPEHEIRNAAATLSCRREPRSDVDAVLVRMAPTIVSGVTIAELCNVLGGGRVAFRPIVRAIFYGTLECVTDGLIDPTTVVRFSGAVMPDFDADGPIKVKDMERVDGTPPKPAKRKPGFKHASHRMS